MEKAQSFASDLRKATLSAGPYRETAVMEIAVGHWPRFACAKWV